ncbi:leucine-rich repeat protein (LRRP) [Trypanosoma brucei equiperdum]|uniref:Leucine-rich repeat protein (LRRP) n=1 Tax=Trypanosoma brucei equiperdum TaxID=630700 RepID=A0A3L6KZJ3_9TRYP|nr:leucine-rich repeat protein (LRRP) [Trypanosoma brucei equiperdum]
MYTVAPAPGCLSRELHVSGRNKNIKDIDLGAVFFTHEDKETLALITSFNLSHNCIEKLLHLDALVSLTSLDVSHNRINVVGTLPITITRLNLSNNGLVTLDNVGALRNLRELDVSHNRLDSFIGLRSISTLQILRADNNRIFSVSELGCMTSLHFLSLDHNVIRNVNELVFLTSTKHLEMLSLCGNPVSNMKGYKKLITQLCPGLLSLDGLPLASDTSECVVDVPDDDEEDEELLTPVARLGPCPAPHPLLKTNRAVHGGNVRVNGFLLVEGQGGESATGKGGRADSSVRRSVVATKCCGNKQSAATETGKPPENDLSSIKVASSDTSVSSKQRDSLNVGPEGSERPQRGMQKQRKLQQLQTRGSGVEAPTISKTTSSYASKIASKVSHHSSEEKDGSSSFSGSQPSRDTERLLRETQVLVEELRKENGYLRARNKKIEAQLREVRRVVTHQLDDITDLRNRCAAAESLVAASKEQMEKVKRHARATGKYTHSAVDAMALEQERLRAGYEAQIADLNVQLRDAQMRLKKATMCPIQQSRSGKVLTLNTEDINGACTEIEISLGEGMSSPTREGCELSLVLSPTDTTTSDSERSVTRDFCDDAGVLNGSVNTSGIHKPKSTRDTEESACLE